MINQFLVRLSSSHHELLLTSQGNNDQLNQIRKDIYICLNDLYTLNNWLINNRLDIEEEVMKLDKKSAKLCKLHREFNKLTSEKKAWELEEIKNNNSIEIVGYDMIKLHGNYHDLLNAHIDEIGIDNTSLNDNFIEDNTMSKQELSKTVLRIQSAKAHSDSEIKQLESLLSNFKKDNVFITNELTRYKNRWKYEINYLDKKLEIIKSQQKSILLKLGLIKQTPSNKLFSFTHSKQDIDDNCFQTALNQSEEFIQIKKTNLQNIISECKQKKLILKQHKDVWRDAIEMVTNLETLLHDTLIKNNSDDLSSISEMITSTIENLETLNMKNCDSLIKACIEDEIFVLQHAIDELHLGQKDPIKNLSNRHLNETTYVSNDSSSLLTNTGIDPFPLNRFIRNSRKSE